MNSHTSALLLAPLLAAAGLALSRPWSAPRATAENDPRQAMLAALGATGPHPSLGAEGELFDRFVGTWDTEYAILAPDGSKQRYSGEVRFGWVLDGLVLQDIWIARGPHGERTAGTTLRFFDEKKKSWRVVWIAPAFQTVTTLEGGRQGERIVLCGTDADGSLLRWSFEELRTDSFVWHGERSRDDGKTWQLEEENHMRRRVEQG